MGRYECEIWMASEDVSMVDGNMQFGETQLVEVERFDTLPPMEALRHFIEMYCDDEPMVFGNSFASSSKLMALDKDGDMMEPTKEMLEAYEQGKMKLYSVSYAMDVFYVEELAEDVMEGFLEDFKKEAA